MHAAARRKQGWRWVGAATAVAAAPAMSIHLWSASPSENTSKERREKKKKKNTWKAQRWHWWRQRQHCDGIGDVMAFAMAFAAAVLGCGDGNHERTAVKKKNDAPFNLPIWGASAQSYGACSCVGSGEGARSVFVTAVLGSWGWEWAHSTVEKKKLTHLSTCPFKPPWPCQRKSHTFNENCNGTKGQQERKNDKENVLWQERETKEHGLPTGTVWKLVTFLRRTATLSPSY